MYLLRVVRWTVAVCLLVVCTGCTIGVKENNNLLFISAVPIPEAAKGMPIIATEQKVTLAVLNKPELTFERSIAGYVVVDPWTFSKLVEVWNASGR